MADMMVTTTPIIALDVANIEEAQSLVHLLGGSCDFYKVGLELFCAEGPEVVRWLRSSGKRVFLDLKLHDIPNTVRGAARSAARLGASLLTVHASGGSEMMRAAVAGVKEGAVSSHGNQFMGTEAGCDVLGVTVLTSHDSASQGAAWGRTPVDVVAEVLRLAGDASSAGAAGIVCSGHEAGAVHEAFGPRLGLLVPGIRLDGGSAHDQKRVMTPAAAQQAGARWIILGRAVTDAPDPVAAMGQVHAALEVGRRNVLASTAEPR